MIGLNTKEAARRLRDGEIHEISKLKQQFRVVKRGNREFLQIRSHGEDWDKVIDPRDIAVDQLTAVLAALGVSPLIEHLSDSDLEDIANDIKEARKKEQP